jgi:hypothetical protein
MRIPARSFDAARRGLKDLGIRVERESIQGQDVTAQFVDLKARLEILQARKDALLNLLHKASSLDAILRDNIPLVLKSQGAFKPGNNGEGQAAARGRSVSNEWRAPWVWRSVSSSPAW